MSVPRQVVVTMLGLAGLAAGAGLWAGLRPDVTQTDVIDAAAARYVRDTGGSERDCVGVPGTGAVWVEVRCGDGAAFRTYLFDESGARLPDKEDPSA